MYICIHQESIWMYVHTYMARYDLATDAHVTVLN